MLHAQADRKQIGPNVGNKSEEQDPPLDQDILRGLEDVSHGRDESVQEIRAKGEDHRVDGSVEESLAVSVSSLEIHREEDQIESGEDQKHDPEERGVDVQGEVERAVDDVVKDAEDDAQDQMKDLKREAHADAGRNDVASSHRKHLREDQIALLVVGSEQIGHADPEVIEERDRIDPLRNEHEQPGKERDDEIDRMKVDQELLLHQLKHDGHLGTWNDR